MASIFLINRPADPENPKRHTVIVCDSARVARHEAGDSAGKADVWQCLGKNKTNRAFLLIRWKGLDVDYADDSTAIQLPDGSWSGFHYPDTVAPPWTLLKGAVWWSSSMKFPNWITKKGVVTAKVLPEERIPLVTEKLILESEQAAQDKRYGARSFGYRQLPKLKEDVNRRCQPMLLPGFGDVEEPKKERKSRKKKESEPVLADSSEN